MPMARFTVVCDECIRIEWSPTERFVDEPSLLVPNRPLPRRVVIAEADAGSPLVEVRTSRVLLRFLPDGQPLSAANLSAQISMPSEGGRRLAFWRPGDRNEHNLGGTVETLDGVRGPIPIGEGLLSRDGWQVLDDSAGHLLVDGWVAARAWRDVPEASTDWYLFAYGLDYAAALRAFTRLAGPVPVPRRAALGSWYSRYWPHTSAEFRGIVADYHQHGIPLDIMVLDMDWHSASARDQWTGWSWNRGLLPDAEELLSWMHGQGLQIALNLHPADGVGPQEDRYHAFMREQGADAHTGERLAFDAGNRGYMAALFNEVLAPLEHGERVDQSVVRSPEHWTLAATDAERSAMTTPTPPVGKAAIGQAGRSGGGQESEHGVDFWWLDWQQDRFVPSVPGLGNLAWLNRLFFAHSARAGRRGISLSRWAGVHAGDHRHPVHFSGDAHTGWEMLAFQVPFTVAAGNAGCFYWSHDIGGHFGPRIEECTARWCWFGALSAAMRLHSARTAALDRRPWTYAEPFASAMKRAFALRSTLMPVIDAAAHECEAQSLPLLRPMYLGYPELDRAYRVHGQYTIGKDLLVAPITSPGVGDRCIAATAVWFPPGSAWFNWFSHERYEPGSEACVAATIDETPLFAPAGVPILTRSFSHKPATEPIDRLVIRLYQGEPGTEHARELYEDDGDTLGYRRGECRRTPVRAKWGDNGRLTLTVGAGAGTFPGAISQRAITVELAGVNSIHGVTANGADRASAFDEHSGIWRIDAGTMHAANEMTIEARIEPRSAREHAQHAAKCRDLRAAALAPGSANALPDSGARHLAAKCGIGAWPETTAAGGIGVSEHARPDSIRICDPFGSIEGGTLHAQLIERLGPADAPVSQRVLGDHELRLGPGLAASIPLPSAPIVDPPTGLRCSRIARFSFRIGDEMIVHEALAETRMTPLAPFVVRGPFPWDWRKAIDEQVFDPEKTSLQLADLESWPIAQSGERWPVDLRRSFPGQKGVAYAAAILNSARPQRATLHLDSGDRIEAWLNGVKVFSLNDQNAPEALTSEVSIDLPEGASTLLIKTNDGGGGWGFAATVDGQHEIQVMTRQHHSLLATR
jgi:hypothetical protein